ncbi:MAG TPA: hypothetical protein VKA46_19300 [Gemmataceae bacterium]|nr:hypothetical protein [Gemmataceae bacterium]
MRVLHPAQGADFAAEAALHPRPGPGVAVAQHLLDGHLPPQRPLRGGLEPPPSIVTDP